MPNDVTICLERGLTGSFYNVVLLRTGEITSEEIQNHLRDDCNGKTTSSLDGL